MHHGLPQRARSWFDQEKPDFADGIKKDDWTKKQRFDRLRQALRDCTHAGVHNDASQSTRLEAVLALSTLVALIAVRSQ